MTNKQCEEAQKNGKCKGMCDQCSLDGHKPRKEFGIPFGGKYDRKRND